MPAITARDNALPVGAGARLCPRLCGSWPAAIGAGPDRSRSARRLSSAAGGKCIALDFDDDLVNECSQQLLPVARRGRACVPDGDEIGSPRESPVALLLGDPIET